MIEAEYVEVEDARTGEMIPIKPEPPKSNTLSTSLDLTKVGTLVLDDKAEEVLAEALKDEDVRIRPDGLAYLPWTWYAERLNRAFGRLQWGLVPQASPQSKDIGNNMVLVVWGHWLVVRGVVVGFEIGETAYRTNNNQMSFGDAAAGAKSNSLARNCKMLGISLELWDFDWVNAWKQKYAETYEDRNGKTLWRKKNKITRPSESQKTESPKGEETTNTEQVTEPKQYTVKSLRNFEVVKSIASMAGVKNSDVTTVINSLDDKSKYTIAEIVKKVKGE